MSFNDLVYKDCSGSAALCAVRDGEGAWIPGFCGTKTTCHSCFRNVEDLMRESLSKMNEALTNAQVSSDAAQDFTEKWEDAETRLLAETKDHDHTKELLKATNEDCNTYCAEIYKLETKIVSLGVWKNLLANSLEQLHTIQKGLADI